MRAQDDKINRAVGEHFRRARESLGWTLEDVSRRVEQNGGAISLSALSRFERGLMTLSLIDSIALCRSLGTSFATLEELVRTASVRELVDISNTNYEELMARGRKHRELGDLGRALRHFEAAFDWLQLSETEDAQDKIGWALIEAADVQRQLFHFNAAQDIVARLLNGRSTPRDHRIRAMVLSIVVSYTAGDYFRARVTAHEVEKHLGDVSEKLQIYALAAIGTLCYMEGRYEQAITPLQKACDFYSASGSWFHWAKSVPTLAYCIALSGRTAEGVDLLSQVRDFSLKKDYLHPAYRCFLLLGRIRAEQGLVEQARADFEASAVIARKRSNADDLFLSWHALWKLEKKSGDAERRSRIEMTMKRLLRRLTTQTVEVEEFTREISLTRSRKEAK